nr:Chain C, LEU-PRO-ALA-CYS-VAL-LEU-GLU-VAL [Rous sarcoma virus - Prague C]5YMW_F Chain F, LEU-PRO-ALA-CYS-VAL-LEU-GLU-VAL [Rous sarcoma virus - Prague C]5YMW_I Chain I, LEU-PRO-ALA-CYS-VAL-LEU-GLU-VAL [Rous sarcoma virus - Prague C]5YMW_L Chain L, LEU-PRO-ALA-CYS-VAL-LEU-GLU-VAL [Rous sarcoma virus - Prague C]
LPACVLEV